jgi:hypothetical protein
MPNDCLTRLIPRSSQSGESLIEQPISSSNSAAREQHRQAALAAGVFDGPYTFTFDPPLAPHADEYHSLKVELSQPNVGTGFRWPQL